MSNELTPVTLTRTSMYSDITRTRTLNLRESDLKAYEGGKVLLQDAFPYLPPADREWIKTGITDEEWKSMFAHVED